MIWSFVNDSIFGYDGNILMCVGLSDGAVLVEETVAKATATASYCFVADQNLISDP